MLRFFSLTLMILLLLGSSSPAQDNEMEEMPVESLQPPTIIGIGDNLQVIYYDQQKLDDPGKRVEVMVLDDGTIYLPLLGSILAVSKSTRELEQDLFQRLRHYILNPQVQVLILEEKSNRVSLLGALSAQGLYPLQHGDSLIKFISRYGGIQSEADLSNVIIMREPGQIIRVDLTTYFEFGDLSQDIFLQNEDKIFLPVKPVPWFEKAARVLQVVTFILQITTFAVVLSD